MTSSSDYLAALPPEQAEQLARVNSPALTAMRRYLGAGTAVAFLGAGASAPLYPLWTKLIDELIDVATTYGLSEAEAATCRGQAATRPDAVVQILRRHLGVPRFHDVLRVAFAVRRDPVTGRTWTPVQELVCRCAFRAVVTTNYDPGIVDARVKVRPNASSTAFTSWTDELGLDRWLSGDVFDDDELPVLFAHGRHSRPEEIVLAATEYRRAYAGRLGAVLSRLITVDHLIWIGFSFADARIAAIQREIATRSGTAADPGAAPRQVAIMPWDPKPWDGSRAEDPAALRRLAEIDYCCDLVLYPTRGGEHSALQALLTGFADPRYLAVP